MAATKIIVYLKDEATHITVLNNYFTNSHIVDF